MRPVLSLLLLGMSMLAPADTTYLGMYIKGKKIGYSSYDNRSEKLGNQRIVRSDSRTVMDTSLLGTSMSIQMDSKSWSKSNGDPIKMWSSTASGGRTSTVTAAFGKATIALTISNGGGISHRSLPRPTDLRVVDDPLTLVLQGTIKAGTIHSFYVFDPSTASLVKNVVKVVGKQTTHLNNKNLSATLIEVTDPRSTMRVFVDLKGNLVKVEGPAGIDLIPVSRKVALSQNAPYEPSTDLAFSTSIKINEPLDSPADLAELKIRLTAKNLTSVPSDPFQSASQGADGWVIDIHPIVIGASNPASITDAAKGKPEWLKPSLNMPSQSPKFTKLARQITKGNSDVQSASFAIRRYVYDNMKPNAGIGVLRDATEVLDSKEGVCRDYATLTVTLLRSAGIPARLASGLVNWDGTFYYHAWAEAWDGKNWIGIDSTSDQNQISAAHVKLSQGNVEAAFSFTFLEQAKIEVLSSRRKQ